MKFEDVNGNGLQDNGEQNLEGWTITATGNGFESSTQTDADGFYEFTGVPDGTFLICEQVQSGWNQTFPSSGTACPTGFGHSVSVSDEGSSVNNNFGNRRTALNSINGVKFKDLNANGIRDGGDPGMYGWVIFIDTNNNELFDNGETSTLSGAQGLFSFNDLQDGTYILREVQHTGWTRTTPNPDPITVSGGENITDVLFGNNPFIQNVLVANKTVGEPKALWSGDNTFYNLAGRCNTGASNSVDCWRVTLQTPVSMGCENTQGPADAQVCFNVGLDGDDATQDYCDNMGGQMSNNSCCMQASVQPTLLYFSEESQHELSYYCQMDGVRSPVDDEFFKVEGNAFKIQLNKKWNLISVPFELINSSPEFVFRDVSDKIVSVWTYDPNHQMCGETDAVSQSNWCVWTPQTNGTLRVLPGWGYWILAKNDTNLTVGGSLFSPVTVPPSKNIASGWNLIGYYGDDDRSGYNGPVGAGKSASCALGSLVDTTFGYPKWSSLVSYWERDNPHQWKMLNATQRMDPGAGYWIEMDSSDLYSLSTAC